MIIATVTGNLCGDAAVKRPAKGTDSVCEFTVASNERGRGDAETTTFVRCSMWGRRGEALAPSLTKGTKVTVIGPLKVEAYKSEKDGNAHLRVDLKVDEFDFAGGKRKDAPRGDAAPSRPAEANADEADDEIPF